MRPARESKRGARSLVLRSALAAVREHLDAIVRDGDRMLEMGGRLAVLGDDRPAVLQQYHVAAPGNNHGLDRDRRAALELEVAPELFRRHEIRDLRVLVDRKSVV